MAGCCVTGCNTTPRDGVMYFEFPTSRLLRRRWLDAIQPIEKVDQHARVCIAHFLDDDYVTVRGKVRLKAKVVPSVFNRITDTSEQNPNASASKIEVADTATVRDNAKLTLDTQSTTEAGCVTNEDSEDPQNNVEDTEKTAKVTQENKITQDNANELDASKTAADKDVTEEDSNEVTTRKAATENKSAVTDAKLTVVVSEDNKVDTVGNKSVTQETASDVDNSKAERGTSNVKLRDNRVINFVDRFLNKSPIDINKDDIEEILTNYHIKQTKPLHKMIAERERGSETDANVIEINETEDRPPVFIEVAVAGDNANQQTEGETDGNDCLMVLESVQVEVDPTTLMLPDRESEDSDVEIKEVEPEKKTDPISLLTSSDEDEVIIQEPHIDTVVVPDETDEDDVPLVKLVKPRRKIKKSAKRRANQTNKIANDLSAIMWGVYDYYCIHCQFKTTSRGEHKRHVAGHSTVLHICPLCSYTTASKLQFARHKRKHRDEKKFKCHICDYKARHNMSLIYHLKAHDGVNLSRAKKGFKCDKCGFNSDVKSAVLKHVRLCMSNVKRHCCDKCDYETNRQSDLKRHIMRKHKEAVDDDYVP